MEATEKAQQLLGILVTHWGYSDPRVARVLRNIGYIKHKENDLPEAVEVQTQNKPSHDTITVVIYCFSFAFFYWGCRCTIAV